MVVQRLLYLYYKYNAYVWTVFTICILRLFRAAPGAGVDKKEHSGAANEEALPL